MGRQEEGDSKTLACNKCDRAITCMFCSDPHLTLMFSDLLQKDLLKVKFVLWKVFSNKIIVRLVTQGLLSSSLSRPVA